MQNKLTFLLALLFYCRRGNGDIDSLLACPRPDHRRRGSDESEHHPLRVRKEGDPSGQTHHGGEVVYGDRGGSEANELIDLVNKKEELLAVYHNRK
jgi:hypothetical protein